MTWTAKQKELVAVGISVAAGCRPCTDYHLKAVRKSEATEAEIRDAIERAASIRQNAADAMRRYALGSSVNEAGEGDCGAALDRVSELLAVGAAYAVNCTETLGKHLSAARKAGITEAELREAVELAAFIKGMGDRHVRKLADYDEAGAESAAGPPAASASPCAAASDAEGRPASSAAVEEMRGRCC